MSILVESSGLLTTLQDLGRLGYQHLGIGPSGAMDEVSHRMANLLAGNPAQAATLEITHTGPTLRFDQDTMIVLCGGDLTPEIEDRRVPLWRPVMVRAGARLGFGEPVKGFRCYLAVAGGFRVEPMMNSASTNLAAGFGGFRGRPLKEGDRLETGACPEENYPTLQWRFHRGRNGFLGLDWFAPWFRELDFLRPAILRLVPGPQWDLLTSASRATLTEAEFTIAANSDRMGIRMHGPRLFLEHPVEMISSGVATGSVQLPPDGSPILLMAERQTTGGYPRLGELASVDRPKAAQLGFGETLRFQMVSLEAAQERCLQREARFRELERILDDRRRR